MTEHAPSASGVAGVACPFVAFADDRDRRADTPDRRNHCYAEPVPQQRALAYQAEYCLAPAFAGCHVFLAWASRAAAAPTGINESPGPTASRQPGMVAPDARETSADGSAPSATGSAIALTDGPPATAGAPPAASVPPAASGQEAGHAPAPVTGRDWLFDMTKGTPRGFPDTDEWVPTTAWLGLSGEDPDAGDPVEARPARAGGLAAAAEDLGDTADTPLIVEPDPSGQPQETPAPIPAARLAALPVRRRRTSTRPLRPIGSGEWEETPPLSREPLVRRRLVDTRVGLLLGIITLLVLGAAFLVLPGLLAGGPGQEDVPGGIAGASDEPAVQVSGPPGSVAPDGQPAASPTSTPLAEPSPSDSAEPGPTPRTYRIRKGDTLSRVASRFKVTIELLQCVNGIPDPNVLSVGQELIIPRRGAKCPDQDEPSPGSAEG